MRKSAITCFAFLYGIVVHTAALERFNEWIAQEALGLGHFVSGQHFLCLTQPEKSETKLQYKKLVERPFAIEAPRESAGILTGLTGHISSASFESYAAWNDPPVSPRAPPFQI